MQSKINLKINLKKVSQKCPKTALQLSAAAVVAVAGPAGPPCKIGYANIIKIERERVYIHRERERARGRGREMGKGRGAINVSPNHSLRSESESQG